LPLRPLDQPLYRGGCGKHGWHVLTWAMPRPKNPPPALPLGGYSPGHGHFEKPKSWTGQGPQRAGGRASCSAKPGPKKPRVSAAFIRAGGARKNHRTFTRPNRAAKPSRSTALGFSLQGFLSELPNIRWGHHHQGPGAGRFSWTSNSGLALDGFVAIWVQGGGLVIHRPHDFYGRNGHEQKRLEPPTGPKTRPGGGAAGKGKPGICHRPMGRGAGGSRSGVGRWDLVWARSFPPPKPMTDESIGGQVGLW